MKRAIYTLLATLLLAGCTADLEEQRVSTGDNSPVDKIINSPENCVKGKILVRFKHSAESRLAEGVTRSGATRSGIDGVDAILDGVGGVEVKPIFVTTDKNREKVREAGLHLWYKLSFDKDSDMEMVAKALAKVADVERVQFSRNDYNIVRPMNTKKSSNNAALASSVTTRTSSDYPFNDPLFYYQWGLENYGSSGSVSADRDTEGIAAPNSSADINAISAWKLCKGDPSIIVAVLDEGVMYSHEDLTDNMWVNQAELNGRAKFDDDGNGYVDDIYGYNFYGQTSKLSWNNWWENNYGQKEGDSGHGTHVAGIISAVNNNGIGLSSIAGGSGNNDGVRILSAQTISGGSSTDSEYIAQAMQYAADCGAHIIQCSWGWPSSEIANAPSSDSSYERVDSGVEAAAIKYFIKNGGSENGPLTGGLAIFAAGNDGARRPGYPAAYEPCVAVAALSPGLRPTWYTNYGEGTDILAPGGEAMFYSDGSILSTVPKMHATDSRFENYEMMDGTSMACPMVSGVAALGLSYAKQLGKHYTAEEFRSMLLSATNDIESHLTGSITYFDGRSDKILNYLNFRGKVGAGYIDAYKLLLQIDGTPFTTIKVNSDCEIDLAPYFGDGASIAQFSNLNISDEDKANIGFDESKCNFEAGKLKINCSKCGAATFEVTLLVGGGSLSDKFKPYPTKVTKKFVVFVRSAISTNGGWL